MKIEVSRMHETLEQFTKGKYKLDLMLFNQKALYNKNLLGYKPNRSFKTICHNWVTVESTGVHRNENLIHPQWTPANLPTTSRVKTRKNGYGHGFG